MSEKVLSPKKMIAIAALLTNPTLGAAAMAAGVNPKTLSRWLQAPNFNDALRAAEAAIIADNVRVLITDMNTNREVMAGIRDSTKNNPGVRLRAAIAIDNSLKAWRDIYTMEQRLTAIENRLEINNE